MVYSDLNNGVYRCGFATTQAAYERAYDKLFACLDWLEDRLRDRRYLAGDTITEADIRLWPTLARFDAVYHGHFKCNRNKLTEMPVLWAYARDLWQTPGFGDTIDFAQTKQHYYRVHTGLNPTQIVPKGPDPSGWLTPHHREQLGGRPFGDGSPPGPPPEAERVPALVLQSAPARQPAPASLEVRTPLAVEGRPAVGLLRDPRSGGQLLGVISVAVSGDRGTRANRHPREISVDLTTGKARGLSGDLGAGKTRGVDGDLGARSRRGRGGSPGAGSRSGRDGRLRASPAPAMRRLAALRRPRELILPECPLKAHEGYDDAEPEQAVLTCLIVVWQPQQLQSQIGMPRVPPLMGHGPHDAHVDDCQDDRTHCEKFMHMRIPPCKSRRTYSVPWASPERD
jgi:hypothetical protein